MGGCSSLGASLRSSGLSPDSSHRPRFRSVALELPNRTLVEIPRGKVTQYLLALGHPVGGPKAKYFGSRGFSDAQPEVFEQVLREVALNGEVVKVQATEWGTKYVVVAEVLAPDGNPLVVSTVWIVAADDRPVLVTAYPTRRGS